MSSDVGHEAVAVTNHPMTADAPAVTSTAAPTVYYRIAARTYGFIAAFQAPVPTEDAPYPSAAALFERAATAWGVEPTAFRLYNGHREILDRDPLPVPPPVNGQTERIDVMLEAEFDYLPPHLSLLAPGDVACGVARIAGPTMASAAVGTDGPDGGDEHTAAEGAETFAVVMVRAFERKPFLGGLRNKLTDAVYHHAACQTISADRLRQKGSDGRPAKLMVTRMTQTQGKTRSCQTTSECGTQMPRGDLLVTHSGGSDRIVVALPYFSADRLLELQTQKCIRIQALVRGWRARKLAQRYRDERDVEEAALIAEDERRRAIHHKKRQEEVERRVHPRSAADFAVLYNELEAWRLQEAERIRDAADIPESERRLALQELLKKETKLLQTIDRLQLHANAENRTDRIQATLSKMSAPKQWGVRQISVETPFTARARELKDLYNGLTLAGVTVDERLDILLHVKWTVKEFNCPLTREIVELVDREADLLNRGRKDSTLGNLRRRVANLFLQFVETPEFNPEALAHQRAPLEFASRPLVTLAPHNSKR
jgi:hypothetical protein